MFLILIFHKHIVLTLLCAIHEQVLPLNSGASSSQQPTGRLVIAGHGQPDHQALLLQDGHMAPLNALIVVCSLQVEAACMAAGICIHIPDAQSTPDCGQWLLRQSHEVLCSLRKYGNCYELSMALDFVEALAIHRSQETEAATCAEQLTCRTCQ